MAVLQACLPALQGETYIYYDILHWQRYTHMYIYTYIYIYIFHHECIAPWLRSKRVCPLCKVGIDKVHKQMYIYLYIYIYIYIYIIYIYMYVCIYIIGPPVYQCGEHWSGGPGSLVRGAKEKLSIPPIGLSAKSCPQSRRPDRPGKFVFQPTLITRRG